MAIPSRSAGVTKNVLIVALFLLVGGAAAFVMRETEAPRAPPVVLEEPDGGSGALSGRPEVPSGGPTTPTDEPEVPSRDEKKDRVTGARIDLRAPRRLPQGPKLRMDSADVWCEGLAVERCGRYPEDCEVAVHCDGVRFCRTQSYYPSQETCAAEGILGASLACCPGLVARCGVPSGGDTCNAQLGDESEPVCIRCGDGVCGPFEQVCNCPEDCATSEARPKRRYRGLWPEGASSMDAVTPAGTSTPGQCLDIPAPSESVQHCLVAWSEGLFGLRTVAELQRVDDLKPFTSFDIDLMSCLERPSSYSNRRSESSREGCIEALYQRTQDSRLDKVRWFSTTFRGER